MTQRIDTRNMTRAEWLEWRRVEGLGASEVAAVIALNPYLSALELFYRKVGDIPEEDTNQAMMFGKMAEEMIAEAWTYYDKDPQTMAENYESGVKVRTCQRVNAYLRNEETPFLFASLDRRIHAKDGEPAKSLEIKNLLGYAMNKWEAGIPPSYYVQLQQQLYCSGLSKGELAILKDGKFFELYEFDYNPEFFEGVMIRAREFWDLVLQARELRKKDPNADVSHLEPDVDGSKATENFLKDRYKEGGVSEREGKMSEHLLGMKCLKLTAKKKALEKDLREITNEIKNSMKEVERLNFGAAGKITWIPNAKGVRSLRVAIKEQEEVNA